MYPKYLDYEVHIVHGPACTYMYWLFIYFSSLIEPFEGASVDVNQLEVPRGEIGEVILTGWHVNVIQV